MKNKMYPRGILQFTFCKSPIYPEIEVFLKSGQPDKYPNLEWKALEDLDPMIMKLNTEGIVEHKENIKNWTNELINTF